MARVGASGGEWDHVIDLCLPGAGMKRQGDATEGAGLGGRTHLRELTPGGRVRAGELRQPTAPTAGVPDVAAGAAITALLVRSPGEVHPALADAGGQALPALRVVPGAMLIPAGSRRLAVAIEAPTVEARPHP